MTTFKDFDLSTVEASATGMDAFFEDSPQEPQPKVAATTRRKVDNVGQLNGFVRTASDTLVHKSSRELWSLQQSPDGEFFIERKFDSDGGPLGG